MSWGGDTGIAIVILNHCFIRGGGEVVIAKVRPLYPQEKVLVATVEKPYGWSERCGVEKIPLPWVLDTTRT